MRKEISLGVDFGGTRIKIALVDSKGRILHRAAVAVRRSWPRKKLFGVLVQTIENFLNTHTPSKKSLLGVGMGLPGLIDFKRGFVHRFINVRGFRNLPLASMLRRRLKLPVFIDNDVNLMTLGEATYGAARGFSQVVCMTLGTGVGGGLILNGELYRGSSLSAGEIGHVPVSRGGPLCACGHRGCFETYVGNRAIVERARQRIRAGECTIALDLVDGKVSRLTPEVLSRAAKRGDRLSLSIWKEVGEWIGIALAGVVNVYNPDRIVIGGGVSEAGSVLFRPVRESLRTHALAWPLKNFEVVPAKLGNDAGVIGASVLVRRSLP
ncbi:MAG: ROK family protein [Candidatus Omnitrophica bacterium]|nr:ROK family protein [Candidatus Omnitrophota bacterium]